MVSDAESAARTERPFRILLVCEANVCRSPMAEYLLRKSLADNGADTQAFELSSAGIHADDGAEMDPRTVEATDPAECLPEWLPLAHRHRPGSG